MKFEYTQEDIERKWRQLSNTVLNNLISEIGRITIANSSYLFYKILGSILVFVGVASWFCSLLWTLWLLPIAILTLVLGLIFSVVGAHAIHNHLIKNELSPFRDELPALWDTSFEDALKITNQLPFALSEEIGYAYPNFRKNCIELAQGISFLTDAKNLLSAIDVLDFESIDGKVYAITSNSSGKVSRIQLRGVLEENLNVQDTTISLDGTIIRIVKKYTPKETS